MQENYYDDYSEQSNAQAATQRQRWEQAIRAKNPDKSYDNEDDLYADAMAGYDSVKDDLRRYRDDDQKLVELLEQHPDVMNFISTLTSTGDFATAYAELPDYASMDDDERATYERAMAGKREERRRWKEEEATRDEKVQRSTEVLRQWADKNGLSEQQVAEFVDSVITKIADRFNSGDFDEDFFETLYRVLNYDTDLQASHDAGVIDGRNQAIGQRAQRRQQSDGLPEMMPSGGQAYQPEQSNDLVASLQRSLGRNAIHQFNQ